MLLDLLLLVKVSLARPLGRGQVVELHRGVRLLVVLRELVAGAHSRGIRSKDLEMMRMRWMLRGSRRKEDGGAFIEVGEGYWRVHYGVNMLLLLMRLLSNWK